MGSSIVIVTSWDRPMSSRMTMEDDDNNYLLEVPAEVAGQYEVADIAGSDEHVCPERSYCYRYPSALQWLLCMSHTTTTTTTLENS